MKYLVWSCLLIACAALAVVPCAAQPADVLPLGRGVGSQLQPPSLTATAPLVGQSVALRGAGLPPRQGGLLLLGGRRRGPAPLPGGAAVYVDMGRLNAILPVGTDTGGAFSFNAVLPATPVMLGYEIVAQAAAPSSAPLLGADVTGAVRLRIGDRLAPPQGPLASLPSPPGPHVKALQSLGDDAWLDLGVPTPDPTYGLATGRSYTPRLAPAAHLAGAFFTGEGGHGYVNPATNRYVDDTWFYDLNAHRWICVKPGSHVPTLKLRLNANQFEVDGSGNPIPVAQLGHGYELVTYDSDRRAFFMLAAPNTYWLNAMPQRLKWLGSSSLPAKQVASPWLFEVDKGKWRREPPGPATPSFKIAARSMVVHYVPSERAVWFWDNGAANRRKVWFFDLATYRWRAVALSQNAPSTTGNGVSCIDPDRNRIYYFGMDPQRRFRLWFYDIAAKRWVDTQATSIPPANGRAVFVTRYAGLTYDATSRKVVLKLPSSGQYYPSFYVYSPTTNAFSTTPITPPTALRSYFRYSKVNAFYSPDYNVHVLHVSGERSATGRVIAYRLRR